MRVSAGSPLVPRATAGFSSGSLALLCTAGYHWLMFGPEFSRAYLIENFNYSLQTITTIGYGNWVPADWNPTDPEKQRRILNVKALSIFFMLVGGSLFVVLLGIVSTFLSRPARIAVFPPLVGLFGNMPGPSSPTSVLAHQLTLGYWYS